MAFDSMGKCLCIYGFIGPFMRELQGFREGLYGLERPIRPSKDFTQALGGLKEGLNEPYEAL